MGLKLEKENECNKNKEERMEGKKRKNKSANKKKKYVRFYSKDNLIKISHLRQSS